MSLSVLWAQNPEIPSELWFWLIPIFAAIVLLTFFVMLVRRYKRCPSNEVLVIYGKTGKGQAARCIHGGAAFVWPLLQEHDYMSLEPIQIEIPLKGALSIENIQI